MVAKWGGDFKRTERSPPGRSSGWTAATIGHKGARDEREFFLCAWRQGGAEWFAKRTSGAGKEKSMQSRGARSVGLRKRREKGENWPSMRTDGRTGSGLERGARRAGKVLTAGLGGVKLFREKGVGECQAAVNAAYVCEFGVERASEGDEHRFRLSARGPVYTRKTHR